MINVLPPEIKENIVYARRNTKLRTWSIALLFSVFGILAIAGIGQMYLQQSTNSYSAQVQKGNDDLKVQKLYETQAQVQSLTDSLKLVTQVLQREVLFSKLLTQIGAALPNGSILSSLSINQVKGGLDLQASAKDYQTATQVQLNLQDPTNKIFQKADILNIQCAGDAAVSNDALTKQYPCTVQIRALFAKNNTFSFISSGSSAP